jgi:dienelactone hydrolase
MMRTDVEFIGAGEARLRGWLYRPGAPGNPDTPAVVMAHGFSATRDMALEPYAEIICGGGMAVLVYDHRNLGTSEGEPRQLIGPWRQARDYILAIGWLATQPGIDPGRLGIWGSSFSGGHVLVVGAVDRRVRAVVANVPFVGLATDDDLDRYQRMESLLIDDSDGVLADAAASPIGPFAVVNEPGAEGPVIMPQPEAAAWFLDQGGRAGSPWRNQVWMASFPSESLDPAYALPHLRSPTLMVVATHDDVAATDKALTAFDRLTGPKELVTIEGHHFSPYSGDPLIRAATAARDFFTKHLAIPS